MAPSVAPVLVAGGGPSGLAAALALLQNDIPVRIIDKEPHYRIGQKANGIWPRTFEVFHFLRAHDIHQRATPLRPLREYKVGTSEPTKTFMMTPHNDPTPSIPYNNPKSLGQPLLEALLRAHLERFGCFVELGTELQSFEDDGDRVLAKLVKRKDGEETTEIFEASYLIGADGAKGATRKRLGLTFLGETKDDFTCAVGDICIEGGWLDRKHWHIYGNRSTSLLMLLPTDDIAPDGCQFMLYSKNYSTQQLLSDQKLLFKCMSEMVGREINVRKVVFSSEFRPNIRMVDKFGVGRVFVAGDAAHVHSPTGGQGLNTSVQDSLNLAWKLSLLHKGLSPATLLDTYTAERLPVVAEMLDITTGIFNNISAAQSMEGMMRREKRLNMLGVNYRYSPIVVDEYTQAEPVSAYGVLEEGVLVAGDRAPDAPGLIVVSSRSGMACSDAGTETRLFDVFSPTYHTVLVFASDAKYATDLLEVLERYPKSVVRVMIVVAQSSEVSTMTVGSGADVVVDRDGHAYQAYLATSGEKKVVVVRPDGVVGAIVHGANGVGLYFSKVLV